MQGSIRLVIGLVIISGSVSSLNTATDIQCLELFGLGILGFASFFSGLKDFIKATNDHD